MFVYLDITGTESGPGDRVDAGVSARYLAMRFGGRAEDTETSEIEIEQIRRGVDAAKSPVHLEVVSLERLLEATAQYDLEDIPPDMLYILYKYILVFNHFKNELTLVEMVQDGEDSGLEEILTLIENRNFASYNFHDRDVLEITDGIESRVAE